MQKCDIDWPICSHEPARGASEHAAKHGASHISFLTCICDVEEERHRHHYKQAGSARYNWRIGKLSGRTISEAECD